MRMIGSKTTISKFFHSLICLKICLAPISYATIIPLNSLTVTPFTLPHYGFNEEEYPHVLMPAYKYSGLPRVSAFQWMEYKHIL
jgi:hypothetical protein